MNAEAGQPSYEELTALVATQRQGIVKLHETVEQQAALIAELQDAASSGRRWTSRVKVGTSYAGLSARVEAILKQAEVEADGLRTEARRAAAEYVAEAEREAVRIRAAAGPVDASADGPASANGSADAANEPPPAAPAPQVPGELQA